MKLTPVEILPDGTWIAEIHRKTVAGGKTRILLDNIGDTRLATHIRVRVIEYQITRHPDAEKNTETFRLRGGRYGELHVVQAQAMVGLSVARVVGQRTFAHQLSLNPQTGGVVILLVGDHFIDLCSVVRA